MDDTVDLLKIKIEKAKRELPLETINAINAVDWRAAILGLREKRGYTFEQLGDLELETELLLCGLINSQDYPNELRNRMRIGNAQVNELVNEMNNLVFGKIREELIKNTERKKIFAHKTLASESEDILKPMSAPAVQTLEIAPMQAQSQPKNGREEKALLRRAGIDILDKNSPLEIPAAVSIPKREDELRTMEKPDSITQKEVPTHEEMREEVKDIHPLLAQKLSSTLQTGIVKTEHSLDNITKAKIPSTATVKNKIPGVDPYREVPE